MTEIVRFGRIDHRLRVRRHGQASDSHQIRRVVIDRQRHAIIPRQIGGLLAVQAAEEVERKAFVLPAIMDSAVELRAEPAAGSSPY